jgi:hypothetical protein
VLANRFAVFLAIDAIAPDTLHNDRVRPVSPPTYEVHYGTVCDQIRDGYAG